MVGGLTVNWLDLLEQRRGDARCCYRFLGDGDAGEKTLSGAELVRTAGAVAAALRAHGVRAGEPVVVAVPPGLAFISGFYGCLLAGAVAVPVQPPGSPQGRAARRLRAVLADTRPTVVLCASAAREPMARLVRDELGAAVACMAVEDAAAANEPWRPVRVDPKDLACLQYTSGSTAAPKGVMLTHGNLLSNCGVIADAFGHGPESRGVIWLPPYHDMGLIGGILQPLYAGFEVTLMSPQQFLRRPLRWLEAIGRFGGTTSGGPNFAYDLCVEHAAEAAERGIDLSTWRVAFTGAEPVRADTLERFAAAFARCGFRREAFFPCYGLAEATLMATGGDHATPPVTLTVDSTALADGRAEQCFGDGGTTLVGAGRARAEVALVDPQTRLLLPDGRVGEVWLRGPGVAAGYWNNREQTAEVLGAKLLDSVEEDAAYLRTGDLGFVLDGEVFITGRLKDRIIIRGVNHYPQDIEATVTAAHPGLQPCGAAAFTVEESGEARLVVVAEVARTHRKDALEPVVAAIREAVAREHELEVAAVALLEPAGLLRTPSGKVRRGACREAFMAGTLAELWRWTPMAAVEREPAASRSCTDSLALEVVQAWVVARLAAAAHVPAEQIDPAEPFLRHGLDSMAAVGLAAEVEAQFSLELPASLLWDYPTPAALAGYVLAAARGEVGAEETPEWMTNPVL